MDSPDHPRSTPGPARPAADDGSAVVPDDASTEPVTPVSRPWWGPLALGGFVLLVVAARISDVVWADWVNEHPAGLLALSSRNRWLALVIPTGISAWSYVLIAAARITAAFVVCHLIGRAYADVALSWFTKYLGMSRDAVDLYNRRFATWELFLIPFFVGSNIVGVLTGIHRTSPRKLAALLALGIAGRLALFWVLAKAFEDQLQSVLRFIGRYDVYLIIGSVVLLVLVNLRNLRAGTGH